MKFIDEYADLLKYRSSIPAEALEALAEFAEIAVFSINLATGEISLNNMTTKLTGYEPGELPQNRNTKMMLTFEDDRHIVSEAMTSLMTGKTNRYYIEYRMRRKDGTLVPIAEDMLVLERDENGVPVKICGLAQDLSRLRWAEEKARRIEKENQALAEISEYGELQYRIRMLHATNEAVSMIVSGIHQEYEVVLRQALQIMAESIGADRAFILRNIEKDGRVCFFTRSIWGKDAILDIQIGQTMDVIAYDDIYPEWKEKFNDQFSIRERVEDLPKPLKDMPLLIAKSVMFIPLYLQGDFFGILGFEDRENDRIFTEDEADIMRAGALTIAASITRNETLQQLNKAREAAISGTKAKAEFLSRMSHEIRTPINAIIGMTSLAKKNKDPENIEHYLEMIDASSKQLLSLINDVLDMSKIDAGKLEILNEPFDFEEMLLGVVHMIRVRMLEKNQKLTVDTNVDFSREMVGDQLRLSQVLINLLSNAAKFTPEFGEIKLTINEKNPPDNDKNFDNMSWIQVSVADTGIGISPEQQSHLFQVFEQADGSITRTYGGSGLGLSICKKIVNLLGGDIWVESEVGKGSDFVFEIPVMWGDMISGSKKKEERRGLKSEEVNPIGSDPEWIGHTILLVEDIEINREIVIGMLEDTGAEIVLAEDGEEGLAIFKNDPERFDIILMDVQMPKMDGLTATKLIRGIGTETALRIPILAMTANAFKDDIDACIAAGMNAHIAKPIDSDELILTITQYMR